MLECAARVIAKEGLERATLARIAKKAKTSPSHIAHYFPRKSELILHVIQNLFETLFADVAKRKSAASPEDSLVNAIHENYIYFEKMPHHYSVIVLAYFFAPIHPEIESFLGKIYKKNLELSFETLVKLNTELGSPRSEAELRRFAEGYVYELEGGLIYRFCSKHPDTHSQFVEQHLEGLRLRIRSFFSVPQGQT